MFRIFNNGVLDISFSSQPVASVIHSVYIQDNQKIIMAGNHAKKIQRLNSDGTLDSSFDAGNGTFGGNISQIIAHQDKILVGGAITVFNGESVNRLVRLNSDGTKDTEFNIGTGFNSLVNSLIIDSDDKILVGGSFSIFNQTAKNYIAKLNIDGSNIQENESVLAMQYAGFNATVMALAIQTDGKILVGGDFTSYNGYSVSRLARIYPDGTLDTSFNIGTGFNNQVNLIKIQTDGKILVGGNFVTYNGNSSNYFIRLNQNGSVDSSFNIGTGFNNAITSVQIQSDNKIIVAGKFTSFAGTTRNYILRLTSAGAYDSTFTIGTGFNGFVNTMVIQSDNKVIVGGDFTSYNGTARNRILRLTTTGTIDTGFSVGTGFDVGGVWSSNIQSDNKVILMGNFSTYNNQTAPKIIRLNTNGTIDTGFNVGTGLTGGSGTAIASVINSEGTLFISGYFDYYNGQLSPQMVSINNNGSFNGEFEFISGTGTIPNAIALESNGNLIIGGSFTSYNGNSVQRILRMNQEGVIEDPN